MKNGRWPQTKMKMEDDLNFKAVLLSWCNFSSFSQSSLPLSLSPVPCIQPRDLAAELLMIYTPVLRIDNILPAVYLMISPPMAANMQWKISLKLCIQSENILSTICFSLSFPKYWQLENVNCLVHVFPFYKAAVVLDFWLENFKA